MNKTSIDLLRYTYFLKSIRGVVLAGRELDSSVINWFRSSIRWRPVGAGSESIRFLRGHGIKSKLIKHLVFPLDIFVDLERLFTSTGIPLVVSEALLLSSIYVSPLIILSENSVDTLKRKRIIVGDVLSDEKLGSRDIKLHLRIAEYAMKDKFFDLIEKLGGGIDMDIFGLVTKKRKNFVRNDLKRFWRINKNRGWRVISYIDPLLLLKDKLDDVDNLIKTNKNILLGLGMIVAVHVENMLKK